MVFHNRPVRAAMESAIVMEIIRVDLVVIVGRPVEPNMAGNLFTAVTT